MQLHKSKKYRVFHDKLHNLFGCQLEEENFLKWLTDKLNIRKSRFIESVKNWEKLSTKKVGEGVGEGMLSHWNQSRSFTIHW